MISLCVQIRTRTQCDPYTTPGWARAAAQGRRSSLPPCAREHRALGAAHAQGWWRAARDAGPGRRRSGDGGGGGGKGWKGGRLASCALGGNGGTSGGPPPVPPRRALRYTHARKLSHRQPLLPPSPTTTTSNTPPPPTECRVQLILQLCACLPTRVRPSPHPEPGKGCRHVGGRCPGHVETRLHTPCKRHAARAAAGV